MSNPDFERMTVDELDSWNVAKKAEIRVLQQEYDASNEPRSRKVAQLHLDEASRQLEAAAARDGRSVEAQAWYWLNDEGAEDDGHRRQAGLWLREHAKVGG